MLYGTACTALGTGKRLRLDYDGFSRVVEVHAVGLTKADHEVMRVWQVRGGSVSNEPIGWKLMRLDETFAMHIIDEASLAPRDGYAREDRVMVHIFCQL